MPRVANMDPFEHLPPECSLMILNLLPVADLGRSELVSTSWKQLVHSWISLFGLQTHFPITCRSKDNTPQTVITEFKRLARQDQALRLGQPISARRYPDAHFFTVAGNFVAWAAQTCSWINWQRLSDTTMHIVPLLRLGIRNLQVGYTLLDMHVNSDGLLLAGLLVTTGIHSMGIHPRTVSYRFVVYSLVARKLIWSMDSPDFHPHEVPQDVCLFIGTHRMYFASRSLDDSHDYDLVARQVDTGTILYRTPISTRIYRTNNGRLTRKRVPRLIHVGGDDLILQLQSIAPLSTDLDPINKGFLNIINGADGRSHTIRAFGSMWCCNFLAHPNSASFAIVSPTTRPSAEQDLTIKAIQIFSRLPDRRFSLTAVHIVTLPPTYFPLHFAADFHPFTFHGVSCPDFSPGPNALILDQLDPDTRLDVESVLQTWWPGVTVNGYHCVVAERPMTLPPRHRGFRRRKLELPLKHKAFAVCMLDEERLIINVYTTGDKYLIRFAP